MRFEDSPALFGVGSGTGTSGGVTCEWCKHEFPDGGEDGETVGFDHFGGLQVADCCFEKVEAAVLLNMPAIVPWFTRYVAAKRRAVEADETRLARLVHEQTLLHDAEHPQLPLTGLPFERGGHRFPRQPLANMLHFCQLGCGVTQFGPDELTRQPGAKNGDPHGRCRNSPFK